MSFQYPLGLLGLIGIPILIIIYIIKSKYTEQIISSTYLWTLSERFLKRKKRLSRFAGIISLILQLTAVLLISLTIAHPVFTVPNAAQAYCFVLDASGSMNMKQGDSTRFELGKQKIGEMIDESMNGSTYSLIYAGETADMIFEDVADKEQAQMLLKDLTVSHTALNSDAARGYAQAYLDQNPAARIYLITDSMYAEHQNVELIDVSATEENYAVGDVTYTLLNETLSVTGNLTSYHSDAELTVELFVDGAEQVSATRTVTVKKEEKTPFELTFRTANFSSIEVRISNEDALALDNTVVLYDSKSENSYSILLVSDRPFFLQSALSALGYNQVTLMATEDYRSTSGYGLYIFDSYTPEECPKDGAVWLLNTDESLEHSGMSVQGEVVPDVAGELSMSASTSSLTKRLIADLQGSGIYIVRYLKCGVYRNFTTLFSYQGNPMIFAGTNSFGNREVVFAFDLHDSNLPLLADYMTLMRNLVDFSFPTVLEKTSYMCGEELEVNVIANCESIRVDTPLNNVAYLDTGSAVGTMELSEAGTYTVTMMVNGTPRQFSVYAELQEAERIPVPEKETLQFVGGDDASGFDGIYDELIIFFVILLVIFIADWMVYCYEKYQLR